MNVCETQLRLYAVTDRAWCGKQTLSEQVKDALSGGATFLQLREKDASEAEFLELAVSLREIASSFNVPFVINDNVEIAKKCNADGVHVGQDDQNAVDIRALLGPDKIIGVSVQTVEAARLAQAQGADYLGVGAMFSTSTKPDACPVSLETLSTICHAVDIPVVAIGGITEQNLSLLEGSGIAGPAVVSAIFAAKDIFQATFRLRRISDTLFSTHKYL